MCLKTHALLAHAPSCMQRLYFRTAMDPPQIQVDRASPPSNSGEEDHCPQSSPGYHPARSPSSRLQLSAILSGRTPSRRKRTTDCTTLSSSRKKTVDEADPNSGRCLVTGAPKENAIVVHCHLLPQRCRHYHDLVSVDGNYQ